MSVEAVEWLEKDYDTWMVCGPYESNGLPDGLTWYIPVAESIPRRMYDQPMFMLKDDGDHHGNCLCYGVDYSVNLDYEDPPPTWDEAEALRDAIDLSEFVSSFVRAEDQPRYEFPTPHVPTGILALVNQVRDAARGRWGLAQGGEMPGSFLGMHPDLSIADEVPAILSPGAVLPYVGIVRDESYTFDTTFFTNAVNSMSIGDQVAITGESFVVVTTNEDGSVNLRKLGDE